MLDLKILPALTDNYIYLIHDPRTGQTLAVDPSEPEIVLNTLNANHWQLTHIINTHHHYDHTGGNRELKKRTQCKIFGPEKEKLKIPGIDTALKEGSILPFGESKMIAYDTGGHTEGHLSYWFPKENWLFVGDTLFSLGCGRLFEGTAKQLWASLDRVRKLPPETMIYCGHEYTVANAQFALTIEPDNQDLKIAFSKAKQLRAIHQPTLPTRLGDEIKTNPFLRPESRTIRRNLQMPDSAQNWEVFAELRHQKDLFH